MMTKKSILAVSLVAIALSVVVLNNNIAKSASAAGAKIGTVNVKKIFDESKKNTKFKEEMSSEQEKIIAEIDKTRAEIEAEKAGLKTVKAGSDEHMTRMKTLMSKQADLGAKQEFYSQKMAMKERQWIVTFYNEIITITREVARERGLDLVLENSQIDLENIPDETLVMSILMRTAIHTEGCTDITEDVMARLDK
ncbi:MAG: OmpH family outer membrane protein [Sedimentisphaerales bacterium]|nr:OmpH family outer membrane protein [Sedimentisphaerales bacterium]